MGPASSYTGSLVHSLTEISRTSVSSSRSCEEIDCIFEKGQVRKNMAFFHAKEKVYKCITDSGRIAGLFPGFFSGKGGG